MDQDIKTWYQNYSYLPLIKSEGNGGPLVATKISLTPNPAPDIVMYPPVLLLWGDNLSVTLVCLGQFSDSDMVNSGYKYISIIMWDVWLRN